MRFEEWIWINMLKKSRIAEHLEISPSYLRMILKGERKPGKELMEKINEFTKGKVKTKDFL